MWGSIAWLLQTGSFVCFFHSFLWTYISGSVMGVGPPDGWFPVDIGGPVSQVEDEEEHGKDDARDLVHFADSVVRLLDAFADVLTIHSGEPHRLGWGRG